MAVIVTVVCLFAIGAGAYSWHQDQRFFTEAVVHGSGTVDARDQYTDSRSAHYFLSYHYVVGSGMYSAKRSTDQGTWNLFHEGSPLPVKYLKDAPQFSRIDLPAEDAEQKIEFKGIFSAECWPQVSSFFVGAGLAWRRKETTKLPPRQARADELIC